jgi:hypothetical protein
LDLRSRPVRRRLRVRLPATSPEGSGDSATRVTTSFGAVASGRVSGNTGFTVFATGGTGGAGGAGRVSPIFGFGAGAARGPAGGLVLVLPGGSGG